jgi:site-specific recombinase XerD
MDSERKPITASIMLDTRRAKKDGTFPVRLHVWDSGAKKSKYYGTSLSLGEDEWKGAMKPKPTPTYKPLRDTLEGIREQAQGHIDQLEHFTFEAFENKAATPAEQANNVFHYYAKRIGELRAANQFGTAETYQLASRSLSAFIGKEKLTFEEVSPRFLQGYEDYMTENGRSSTTISIYLRTLRAIYRKHYLSNTEDARYPFGDNAYQLPPSDNSRDSKAALAFPQEFIGKLKAATAATPEQERARDFFLFSYYANGMNTRDIAKLTFDRFDPNPEQWEKFTYKREKTKRNRKGNKSPKTVTVFNRPELQEFYLKHRNKPSGTGYVFPILNETMNEDAARTAAKNFTRSVNQNLKKLCNANGLPIVTTYAARHSFVTHIIQNGASIETASEMAGHESTRTTQGYYSGQREETMRRAAFSLPE